MHVALSSSTAAMQKAAAVTRMSLTFVAGEDIFSLSPSDVQRYPDSLLASLVGAVGGGEGDPVSLSVQDLPGSPFAAWPGAVQATVALYKNECLPLATLSGLLKTHTAADLYSKLAALIDFLGVPGPVSRLLPPKADVPLRHVGVLDLHHHSLARKAADLITDSVSFNTHRAKQHKAAAFCIAALEDRAQCIVDVAVYAWVWGSIGKLAIITHVWLGAGKPEGTCSLSNLARGLYPTTWGTAVSSKHASLGAPLAAALQGAVAEIPVNGCTGGVRVTCVEVAGRYSTNNCTHNTTVPVWLVRW